LGADPSANDGGESFEGSVQFLLNGSLLCFEDTQLAHDPGADGHRCPAGCIWTATLDLLAVENPPGFIQPSVHIVDLALDGVEPVLDGVDLVAGPFDRFEFGIGEAIGTSGFCPGFVSLGSGQLVVETVNLAAPFELFLEVLCRAADDLALLQPYTRMWRFIAELP
jgi:hypothetical protein